MRFVMILYSAFFFTFLCVLYWRVIMKGDWGALIKKKPIGPKPTMFDVRRLLQNGDKAGAIKLYKSIFKVPSAKAKKDIEDLERNLKV